MKGTSSSYIFYMTMVFSDMWRIKFHVCKLPPSMQKVYCQSPVPWQHIVCKLIPRWLDISLYDAPMSQVINDESSHEARKVLETIYMVAIHEMVSSKWRVSISHSQSERPYWRTIFAQTSGCMKTNGWWWFHHLYSKRFGSWIWSYCCCH
jgi:hypothetical protein